MLQRGTKALQQQQKNVSVHDENGEVDDLHQLFIKFII